MAKKDAYLQLGRLISNFCYVSDQVDKNLDDLILIKENEQLDDRVLQAFGQEINNLKQSHELLKTEFTETMMKFCATDEGDQAYLILQDEEPSQRETKTPDEIFLATQEIQLLYEKELRIWRSFPAEKECAEEYHIRDNATSENTNIGSTEINQTWNWHGLEATEKESRDFRTWSLTKVVVKMYGYTLDKAKKEEEVIRNLKQALSLASKRHRDLTKKNFINEVLGQKKSKLQGLLQAIKAIKNLSECDTEVCEAKELIIEWLYHIEREIFFLVNDLHFLVSIHDNNVAEAKFREQFRSKLARLKRRQRGRVPIVVYRILALLESGKFLEKESGVGWRNDEQVKLEMSFKVGNVMNQLYKMILSLMSVLNASSTLPNSGMSMKQKLFVSAEIVERCDKVWRVIRMKIDELLGSTGAASLDSFFFTCT